MSYNPGRNENFFYFISPRSENIFAKICGILYKIVLWKKNVSYAVTGLCKHYDIRSYQQEK